MNTKQVKITGSRVREVREARGLRAAELAASCGVRRQTIYAIEDGSYIPNTVIALRLARVLSTTVEELFHLADEASDLGAANAELLTVSSSSAQEGQLVQLVERHDKLFAVPIQPDSGFLPIADAVLQQCTGSRVTVKLTRHASGPRETLLLAGCDPALSILRRHIEAANLKVATLACSSQKALDLLKHGRVDIAGCHLLDSGSGEYNVPILKAMFKPGAIGLVHFAAWEQGVLTRSDAHKRPHSIADLGTGDFEIVNREPGSGTRSLLDDYLQKEGIAARRVPGYKRIAAGHLAAAFAVATGTADCCIATNSAARCFGLRFLPVRQERFDLAFRRNFADSKPSQILLDVLNGASLKRELSALAGYETAGTGSTLL